MEQIKMALFKSKREKTYDAFSKLVTKCLDEGKERLNLIYKQLEEEAHGGKKCTDPFVVEFYEIYKAVHNGSTVSIGDGETALALYIQLHSSSVFWDGCGYYIFLNLVLGKLLKQRLKHLSKNELQDLEECDSLWSKLEHSYGIDRYTGEEIHEYIYGDVYGITVRYLFEVGIKLIH
jgi:hypothetical protein